MKVVIFCHFEYFYSFWCKILSENCGISSCFDEKNIKNGLKSDLKLAEYS